MGPSINYFRNDLSCLLRRYGKAELPISIDQSQEITDARKQLVAALEQIAKQLPANNIDAAMLKLDALELEIEMELDVQNDTSLIRCLKNLSQLKVFMRST